MLLRTGVVLGGGYAEKLKRVFFAQTKDAIKRGELKREEAVKAVAELNKVLYEILVEELRVEKGDVVRISIEYEIRDGTVRWNMESLSIEVWPRCPPPRLIRPLRKEEGKEVLIPEEERAGGAQGGPA